VDLTFSPRAWEEYLYWQRTDPQMLSRIHELFRDIRRSPNAGIGKPEPLKHALQSYWSRRITSEQRIVYKKSGDQIWIAQLRYHYR
jgi:toxin YoeB